jgi:hypothetical protein
MWDFLRIILLIGNALVLAWLAYIFITEENLLPSFYALTIVFALNVVYLLSISSKWRVSRLIDLWFDAKENELRKRIDRSRQDK